jgi:acyl-coenzyme A thioesterase PaaI-like protein
MAISLEYVGDAVHGSAELEPSMWASGTRRPRLAILATLVDIVGGHVPDAARTPTVDLRIQKTGPIPETGTISLVGRAHRVGRRIVVAETLLSKPGGFIFARATTTFINHVVDVTFFDRSAERTRSIDSFERLIGARVLDAATLEIVPAEHLSNGPAGTVQGGVQAFLAELAAEHAVGAGAEVVDLDIRFLRRIEAGPLRTRAERMGRTGGLECLRVDLYDAGAGDASVATITLLVAPA